MGTYSILGTVLNPFVDTNPLNPHMNSIKDHYYLQYTELGTKVGTEGQQFCFGFFFQITQVKRLEASIPIQTAGYKVKTDQTLKGIFTRMENKSSLKSPFIFILLEL